MDYYERQMKKAERVMRKLHDGTVYRSDEWREK